jgi:hypothetical protein
LRKIVMLVCVTVSGLILGACGENTTPAPATTTVLVTNQPVQSPVATSTTRITPPPSGSPAITRPPAPTLPGSGIKLPDNPAFQNRLLDAAIEAEFGRLTSVKDAAVRLYTSNEGEARSLYTVANNYLTINGYSPAPGKSYPVKRAGMEIGLLQKAGAPDIMIAAFANDELPPLNENALRNPIPAFNLDLSQKVLESARTGKYALLLVSGEGLAPKVDASLNE